MGRADRNFIDIVFVYAPRVTRPVWGVRIETSFAWNTTTTFLDAPRMGRADRNLQLI